MSIYPVRITKADKTLPVDSSVFSDEVFEYIFSQGLQVVLNKGMSKITGLKNMEEDELASAQADAMTIAENTLKNLIEGNVKARRAKPKESQDVIKEAKRLAREAIKLCYREAKKKFSAEKGSVITQAIKDLIEEDPQFLEQAKKNVEKMKQLESLSIKPKAGSKLASMVAAAEEAKPNAAQQKKAAKAKKGENPSVVPMKAMKGNKKADQHVN